MNADPLGGLQRGVGSRSSEFEAHVERALEPASIDLRDDTGELLSPIHSIVDDALGDILRRHGLPASGSTALRGWAKVSVRAVSDDGSRVRSQACVTCGAQTSKTQRLLVSIAQRSSFTARGSEDVLLSVAPDGIEIAVDVDGGRLAGVLADLDELGGWLARRVVERVGGVATSEVRFVADSFRF